MLWLPKIPQLSLGGDEQPYAGSDWRSRLHAAGAFCKPTVSSSAKLTFALSPLREADHFEAFRLVPHVATGSSKARTRASSEPGRANASERALRAPAIDPQRRSRRARRQRMQLAQELAEQVGRQGRVVLLVALAEHANGRHGVVGDQPGVDGVLEDAPQVVAQVQRDLGRSCLNLVQRSGQFETRDLRDRPVLQAGCQVLVDLPVALQDRRWPKDRTLCGTPVGTHRAEAALDTVQFRLGSSLSL